MTKKFPFQAILGIATEIIYAALIMLAAFGICLAFTFKR